MLLIAAECLIEAVPSGTTSDGGALEAHNDAEAMIVDPTKYPLGKGTPLRGKGKRSDGKEPHDSLSPSFCCRLIALDRMIRAKICK